MYEPHYFLRVGKTHSMMISNYALVSFLIGIYAVSGYLFHKYIYIYIIYTQQCGANRARLQNAQKQPLQRNRFEASIPFCRSRSKELPRNVPGLGTSCWLSDPRHPRVEQWGTSLEAQKKKFNTN